MFIIPEIYSIAFIFLFHLIFANILARVLSTTTQNLCYRKIIILVTKRKYKSPTNSQKSILLNIIFS